MNIEFDDSARIEISGTELIIRVPFRIVTTRVPKFGNLTIREQQVLELISNAKSNKEIGVALGITERTVKAHVSSLLTKYNVGRRAELRGGNVTG